MILIDHNGHERKMGWHPPTADGLKMRASRTSFQALRQAAGVPADQVLIPRSQWRQVDFVSGTDPKQFILDQKSTGACVGFSGAGSLMRVRQERGRPFVRLSGACLYSQINHGVDDGANITDSMTALESQGTCPEADMPLPHIFKPLPTNTTWYREDAPCTLTSFDEIATAMQLGFFPQFPIYVGSTFEHFANGVAGYNRPSSGYGNHSVYGAGLVNQNGAWFILVPNSWGAAWGPFSASKPQWAGCVLISEKHVQDTSHADDAYAHISDIPVGNEVPV